MNKKLEKINKIYLVKINFLVKINKKSTFLAVFFNYFT